VLFLLSAELELLVRYFCNSVLYLCILSVRHVSIVARLSRQAYLYHSFVFPLILNMIYRIVFSALL